MPRTRSSDSRQPTYIYYVDYTESGLPVRPPYNSVQLTAAGTTGGSKSITDEVHPGWIRSKRIGQVTMGAVTISSFNREMKPGNMSGSIPSWKETLIRSGDLINEVEGIAHGMLPRLGDTYSPSMEQIALVKAYAKMNASDIMSGEILSDLGRTVSMMRQPFSSARTLLGKMSKFRSRRLKKSASNLAKASSDAWLEYRYGWQPIILDAATVIKTAHNISAKLNRRLVARGSTGDRWTTSKSFSDLTVDSGAYYFYWPRVFNGTVSLKNELTAFAGVMYDVVAHTGPQDAAAYFGTRASDLPAVAWEIIPYSFVADWFVNIGEWIQAVTPNPSVSVVGSWVSTKQTRVYNVNANVHCQTGAGLLTGSAGSSVVSYDVFRRYCNPPVPSLPTMRTNSLSLLHSVDALTLSMRPILDAFKTFKPLRK